MAKILTLFGTRLEIIKLTPVIRENAERPDAVETGFARLVGGEPRDPP